MPKRSSKRWLLVAALAIAAIAWLWLAPAPKRAPRVKPETQVSGTQDDGAPRSARARTTGQRPMPRTAPRPAAPPVPAEPGESCAPHARRACASGDVYWLDACGNREDKAQECGARLCDGEACEPIDALACAGVPLQGRCDGNIVRGCLEGWPFERDCAALGKRCTIGEEGAVCRKPSEDDCDRFGALPRCEGDALWTCALGKRVVRDCAAMNGRCETLRQTGLAACVLSSELERPPREKDPCGPCGCDEEPEFTDELCNGEDDDGDSWIDEDVRCDPLQVIAYVITDAAGRSSYTREDIELEIARVDELFAAEHGLRMHVALADVIELARPQYLEIDDAELGPLLDELIAGADSALRVPIVFTDALTDEDVPRAGLSTLPNGQCGGIRRTLAPQPLRGLVVVGKRRASTTVAHELGHFMGLCHTHEDDPQAVVRAVHWREQDGRGFQSTCDAACELEGDGMCDTPRDPGPERCDYDTRCDAHCPSGEAPSTRNLMSYYTDCRDRFTPQQSIELRRMRTVLEGWYRCAAPGACPCVPLHASCPEQMSCRPVAANAAACTLDGALMQGEPCRAHAECGADLICVAERCAPWPAP